MSKSYTPQPRISGVSLRRFRAVVDVLSGEMTVSRAAQNLGLSRNHFQALMNRGLQALGEAISPQPPGRPATPDRERELLKENARLQRESERLRKRVETTDQVLVLLRGFLRRKGGREVKSSRAGAGG
jgi:transposase-like protein